MKPTGNHVIVKELESAERPSGLVIAEISEKEKAMKGTVVLVGEECKLNLKIGGTVLFKKYAPEAFEWEDTKYLVLEETDILAIL